MKEKILNYFQNFFVLILVSLIPITNAFARGGGGGSGGGGGGGGGGGSYGGGSGSSSRPLSYEDIIILTVLILILTGRMVYVVRKRNKNLKTLSDRMKTLDPSWNEAEIKQRVNDVFFKFQKDWSDFDSESMKEYVAPEYQKRMSLELAVLKNQKRQNLMSDLSIISINMWKIEDKEGISEDSFVARVVASAKDQLINTENNEVIYTDTNSFNEFWTFVRIDNVWKLNLIDQATEDRAMREDSIADFAKKNYFYYDADFGWLMMPLRGAIFQKGGLMLSDINNHVIGSYRDTIIEFYTYIANPNANIKKNYVVAQVILPIHYRDILVRRKRMLFNFSPRGLRRIHTESNDFERKFCLWAHPQDQVNSFELLAPDFMLRVYELPFELNIEVVDNVLYFYAESRKGVDYDTMLSLLNTAFENMKR